MIIDEAMSGAIEGLTYAAIRVVDPAISLWAYDKVQGDSHVKVQVHIDEIWASMRLA